jgi:hypothetical protein
MYVAYIAILTQVKENWANFPIIIQAPMMIADEVTLQERCAPFVAWPPVTDSREQYSHLIEPMVMDHSKL